MPSPFPGMNPYLEQQSVWRDFHEGYVMTLREALAAAVRPRYFVKVEEHLYVRDADDDGQALVGRPDVSVHPPPGVAVATRPARPTTPPAAARVRLVPPVERVSFLVVRDRDGQEAVTAIELLSPSNKVGGDDRDDYSAKRAVVLATRTHFVEIDLLRGGRHPPWHRLPACDYAVVVSRSADRPHADVWPVRLRDPLPVIPIPLRDGEPDAALDLQAALHRIYDAAGYDLIAYRGRPDPPLSPADAAWAAALVPPAA